MAFLLVEVADSSLRKNRKLKCDLYAEHGIAEFPDVRVPVAELFR